MHPKVALADPGKLIVGHLALAEWLSGAVPELEV